jgi:anti-anti-sigma factor
MEVRTRQEGGVLVVALEGELDAYWAGEAREGLWSQLERGHDRIVLDLAGLTYLSSAGLRILLQLQQRLAGLRGELALAQPQPFVSEVLEASGFARALRLFETVAQATAAVGPSGLVPADLWSAAQRRATPEATLQFRRAKGPLPGETAELRVVGQADDLLYSRAAPERLTTLTLDEASYTLGVGALGAKPSESGSSAALLDRLGELLTAPGMAFWLPGDGREVADFMIAGGKETRLPMHLLCGMAWGAQEPQAHGRFTARDPEAGAGLGDLTRSALDWAAGLEGCTGLVGLALRAEIAGLWGVALKRAPREERAPPNGRPISHRENIRQWLHFATEAAYADHTLLAVGVLADPSRAGFPAGALEAAFGSAERDGEQRVIAHLHGAVFRRVPELGGDRPLAEELRHVGEQGELVSLAHLLPATRLRQGRLGLWVFGAVRQG